MMNVIVQTLDVVMVRPLGFAEGALVTRDRHAILTERAVHVAVAVQRLFGPLCEGFEKKLMGLKVRRRHIIEIGPGASSLLNLGVDPFQQDSGEEKVRLHDDAAKPHAFAHRQGVGQEGGCDAGKGDAGPGRGVAFLEETGHLRDVAVGVRIAGTAADEEQERLGGRDLRTVRQDFCVAQLTELKQSRLNIE